MKTSLPSAILNADLISQVYPFWYTLRDQNKIADLYTPANPSTPMATPLQSMQAAGFKILPTITDGTAVDPKTGKSSQLVLSNLLANPTSRANIVNAILALVMQNNFDGIDLDFENFAFVDSISTWPTTQTRWVQFISDLSTALHAKGKLLSITTPPLFDPASGKKGYYLYAWSQVAGFIDQLHIMAYDYSTSSPGPIGPLQWTTNAVTYAASVIPASKIYIGIPGYGRDWVTKVIGTCPTLPINYSKTVAPGVVSTVVMHDVAALAATYGATPTYNQTFAESSFTYQKTYNGTTSTGALTTCTAYRTVWYQNAQSYTARANLVSQFHLGGLTEWTLGMEDPTAFQSIRAVALSIAPDSISASLHVDSTSITIGTPTQVIGTFALPDKTPVVGVPVHLQVQAPGGLWTTVQDGVTGSDGSFSTTLTLTGNTNIRMFSEGTWQRLEGDTPTVTISVNRLLTWNVPASMKSGVPYTISAQVTPALAGVAVLLSNGASALTDDSGKATFTVTNSTPGFTPYQVHVPADQNFALTQSSFVIVWVR
jgi:spore germination protein YaaH